MRDELVRYILESFPQMGRKLFRDIRSKKFHQDFHVLFVIFDHDGEPMKYYSSRLALSKSNFTKNISRLIDMGYVRRQQDQMDRRVIRLFVTDEGKAFIKERKEYVEKALKERLAVFTEEEADQLLFHFKGIQKIINKIEE